MRFFAICLLALLGGFAANAQAATNDEVRLDHRASSFDSMQAYDSEGSVDTVDAGDDNGTSGSDNLMIRIERNGYATDSDADSDIGGNGPLTRDGGFDFGAN